MKNFVQLDEHLVKHVEKGGEQYNDALKNAAIYSPSKYILSANRSPKKAAGFSGIEHFESSNLSPELPKFDLAKSIDTDALISESPSISFAIESPSECNSLTMEVDSPDVSDSTSKDNPSYSPDAAEILKSCDLSEEFYLPDIIETCLVEFRKFLEGPECFLAKSKEIVAEARRIFIALKLKNIDQLIEGTCIRDYYLAQYCVKQDYRPDSIKKYLRSLNDFVTFLVLKKKKKELKHDIKNERLILLQQKLIKWSGKYKKASATRFFQHQMEDYAVFIDEKHIKQYKESSYYLEPIELFNKFQEGVQNVDKRQFCLLRDFLIVLIELACAHRSGVCANFTLEEFQKKDISSSLSCVFCGESQDVSH